MKSGSDISMKPDADMVMNHGETCTNNTFLQRYEKNPKAMLLRLGI